jgi:mRNA-degrading endonuclease toxin of MazEF toxin-antitoxin module
MAYPHRGEIWLADLRPTRSQEQAGRRPVLVLSVDFFNAGPANLVVVLPLTSTQRDIPLHVKVSKGGWRHQERQRYLMRNHSLGFKRPTYLAMGCAVATGTR